MEWQPIDTAPKDGVRVLAYVPHYGPTAAHFYHITNRWYLHSVLNRDAAPTHWMPLPTPPETE